MLSATAVSLIVASSLFSGMVSDVPDLPRSAIEHGLKKARCDIPPSKAKIVGTEWLGHGLRIVEVSCWQTSDDGGSILFAVPANRVGRPELIVTEDWRDQRVVQSYRVASPTYDRETRTLGSVQKAAGAGDCDTVMEWKWTGWSFRLVQVASNGVACGGKPVEWDSGSHDWQVFPE
jgi:hypothetical protein